MVIDYYFFCVESSAVLEVFGPSVCIIGSPCNPGRSPPAPLACEMGVPIGNSILVATCTGLVERKRSVGSLAWVDDHVELTR